MRETTSSAMPPCFNRWCNKFDDLLRTKAQKREFRNYLGGLLGESERKNIYQMALDSVGVTYHKLHHCLDAVAARARLEVASSDAWKLCFLRGNPQDRAASLLN